MNKRHVFSFCISLAAIVGLIGPACGGSHSGNENAIVVNDNGGRDYHPEINAADFVSEITNPLLRLPVGTIFVYEGKDEDGKHVRSELEVTREKKTIMGVPTTVVRDRSYHENKLVEDTFDWVAQDKAGTVWYFGEASKEIENDRVVSTEGSWEAGVNGAKPGILMLAKPEVGDVYRQEYLKGEAEGIAEVLALNAPVTIAQGKFIGCLQIKEWAPQEPEIVEHKYYCPDLGGLALTEAVKGETGRSELIRTTASLR